MHIQIISAGRIKEKYLCQGIEEYKKRLSRYCQIEIIEVQDEPTAEQPTAKERLLVLEKESQRMRARLKDSTYVIALCIEGRDFSSLSFAEHLAHLSVSGKSHLTFLIGGSLGLDPALVKRADLQLSFSPLTFPHQLMRLLLLEQLYRSYRIIRGEPYHK